jgi:hypothetical protein
MRRTVLAVALLLVVPATATAKTHPVTISNCGKLVQRPASLVLTCADANYELAKLKWSSWGGTTAAATGTASANDCTPYCAAGHFHSYPVTVTVARPLSCPTSRRYTRLTIHYAGTRPRGYAKNDVHAFTCSF